MAARVGDVIYWTAGAVAALWVMFVLVASATVANPDWTISTPIALIGAIVIWIFGWAARYVLSGH
jgi:hypothetical protein